ISRETPTATAGARPSRPRSRPGSRARPQPTTGSRASPPSPHGRSAYRPARPPRPPAGEWALDLPPAEVDAAHPIVEAVAKASATAGEPPSLGGLDSRFDGATSTRFPGPPR